MNFIPPKANLDLEDVGKIFNISYKLGFLDETLIENFLSDNKNLLGQTDLANLLTKNIEKRIEKVSGDLLISYLQSCLWNYGEKNDTGFLIYSIYYLFAKKKYPEMMAFAYKKLLMEAEMMEKLRQIVLGLKTRAGQKRLG